LSIKVDTGQTTNSRLNHAIIQRMTALKPSIAQSVKAQYNPAMLIEERSQLLATLGFAIENPLSNPLLTDELLFAEGGNASIAIKGDIMVKRADTKVKAALLYREALVLQELSSLPGIIKLAAKRDEAISTDSIFLDPVPGINLMNAKEKELFNADEILFLIIQTLKILNGIHRSGYVHRDIKPKNIMVTTDGDIIIIDFGCAEKLGSNVLDSSYSFSKGEFIGDLSVEKLCVEINALSNFHNIKSPKKSLAWLNEILSTTHFPKDEELPLEKRIRKNRLFFEERFSRDICPRIIAKKTFATTFEYLDPRFALYNGATPLADLFSVGIMLYELLCGDTPFHCNTTTEFRAISNKNYLEEIDWSLFPGYLRPLIASHIKPLIIRLIDPNIGNRFPSVDKALEHIKEDKILERLSSVEVLRKNNISSRL